METNPQRADRIVDAVVAALVPGAVAIAPGSPEARERREVQEEVERQIQRALWRAERAARQVPKRIRQSASHVNGRRRVIAYELIRALRSLGAGELLSASIAERGAMRYPRDGVVLADVKLGAERPERPRARGDSPRQRGTNLRAIGASPRQRRAAADLSSLAKNEMHAPATAVENACTPSIDAGADRELAPRERSADFTAMYETQTRELMRELAAGRDVTGHMTPLQRTKFYAAVQAIKAKDAALLQ